MEPNVSDAKSPRRHVVDLSRHLSSEELDRLQNEAEGAGQSLKAYVLALIFVPREQGYGRAAKRKQGSTAEKEAGEDADR